MRAINTRHIYNALYGDCFEQLGEHEQECVIEELFVRQSDCSACPLCGKPPHTGPCYPKELLHTRQAKNN